MEVWNSNSICFTVSNVYYIKTYLFLFDILILYDKESDNIKFLNHQSECKSSKVHNHQSELMYYKRLQLSLLNPNQYYTLLNLHVY